MTKWGPMMLAMAYMWQRWQAQAKEENMMDEMMQLWNREINRARRGEPSDIDALVNEAMRQMLQRAVEKHENDLKRLQKERAAEGAHADEGGEREKKRLRVYLAGPMSDRPGTYREDFDRAAKRLAERGYIVINPAFLPQGLDQDKYMPICHALIDAADALYMLDGSNSSKGARLEKGYALYQGKMIITDDDLCCSNSQDLDHAQETGQQAE